MLTLERNLLIVGLTAVATAVGLLDAATGGSWDFVVILATVAVLQLMLVANLRADRKCLTLRPDLAVWVRARAAATGELPDRIVDDAVASALHRASAPPATALPSRLR
jgi:hypothetical protein